MPNIDALAFGFPCNDFSVVGEQRGFNGQFGPLYSYGIQICKIETKMLDLPEENKTAVYNRMISERKNIAAQ